MNALTLFVVVMIAQSLLIIELLISLRSWERRIYPPPEGNSWQNYAFLIPHFNH